ncbi:MAG: protein kinase [Gemmatimonadetes bacterium]|nr:protein kinase [Gemmatimonadota bacterium]
MPLEPGQKLSHYRLVEKIGEGGMGVVWKAEDTVLKRTVAMKVLPHAFAGDREHLARFEREARLLASLNHPNIAAIYGFEQAEGIRFLVLELVTGETLAERIAAGPLALDETLTIALQIAEGLEAAHERGIIHRDLKPANIQVTEEGKVKILDFGLAKAFAGGVQGRDLSQSPTVTSAGTREGVILGTAPYMSPEQARGGKLDRRTDIWSFGCVLYEMLTRKATFPGPTTSDILAAILDREPNWELLSEEAPVALHVLLQRCLAKDTRQRIHEIADVRIELEEMVAGKSPAPGLRAATEVNRATSPANRIQWTLAAGLAGVILGAALALMVTMRLTSTPHGASPVRADIMLPETVALTLPGLQRRLSLSPDGRLLVYSGARRLYLRAMDRDEPRPLPGTEGGYAPFFSPDGEWIGFFTDRKLKKVAVSGGAAITLIDVPPITQGGAWGPDDRILFAPTFNTGLTWISADGARPESLTELDRERGEQGHVWPQILPGGDAILYVIRTGNDPQAFDESNIVVERLGTGERRMLIEGSPYGRYVHSGHVLFVRGTSVLAVPFDLDRLELSGNPVPILEDVKVNSQDGLPQFAVSSTGTLVYLPAEAEEAPNVSTVLWVGKDGTEEELPLPGGRYYAMPRVSPDGGQIAITGSRRGDMDVWLYDIARDVLTSMTPGPGRAFNPVWTPDGRRLTFTYMPITSGFPNIYWMPADGSHPPEPLREFDRPEFPNSWSPDGKVLAFTAIYLEEGMIVSGNADIWLLDSDDPESARPWFETPFLEYAAIFSPHGRSIAYVSDESGESEIYIRPYPGPGARIKVSTAGGGEPAWSRDGRTLFYRQGTVLMATPVQPGRELRVGTPVPLLEMDGDFAGIADTHNYDVAADGDRFLIVRREQPAVENTRLVVVTDWFTALEKAASR